MNNHSENLNENLKKIGLYEGIQQSEAKNHWTRNSCFLIVESFLILSLSQFSIVAYQALVGIFGIVLSIAWLLIQDRSSRYIKHWKTKVQELRTSENIPDIYPKDLGGVEMRKVAYVLPILFLVFWIFVIFIISDFPIDFQCAQNLTQSMNI